MTKDNFDIMNEIINEEKANENDEQTQKNKLNGFLAGAIGALVGYKYL